MALSLPILTRIIHDVDVVCHNINGRQNLRPSYPKHRVLKPEAQAKESAKFSSLARFEVAQCVFSGRFRNPTRERGRSQDRFFLAHASGYQKRAASKLARRA